jgi:hypothetical protein
MQVDNTQKHRYVLPENPFTLPGFEPGSSDPVADAMSTAPRHEGSA